MSQKLRLNVSVCLLVVCLCALPVAPVLANPGEARVSSVRETADVLVRTFLCWLGADARTQLIASPAAPTERTPMDKAGVEIDPIGRVFSILDLLPLHWLGLDN